MDMLPERKHKEEEFSFPIDTIIKLQEKAKVGFNRKEDFKDYNIPCDFILAPEAIEFKEGASRIFFIKRALTGGSSGRVYEVYDPANPSVSRVIKTRFQVIFDEDNEFEISKKMELAYSHFYILTDTGMTYFIIMDYVPGIPFDKFLENPLCHELKGQVLKSKAEVDWLDLIKQMLAWANKLHLNNILYIDFKPENFLFNLLNGILGLIDYDSAVVCKPKSWTRFCIHKPPSGGSIPATLGMAAPETVLEMTATNRSDIYTLGVIFAKMLGFAKPVQATDVLDIRVKKHFNPIMLAFLADIKTIKTKIKNEPLLQKFKELVELCSDFSKDINKHKKSPEAVSIFLEEFLNALDKVSNELGKETDEAVQTSSQELSKRVTKLMTDLDAVMMPKSVRLAIDTQTSEKGLKIFSPEDREFKENNIFTNHDVTRYVWEIINLMVQPDSRYRPGGIALCIDFFEAIDKFYKMHPTKHKETGIGKEWEMIYKKEELSVLDDLLIRLKMFLIASKSKEKVKTDTPVKFERKL